MAEGRGWWRDAACSDYDPDLFFDSTREEEAKVVCLKCKVRRNCLLEERGSYGVFGGFNESERQTFHNTFIV